MLRKEELISPAAPYTFILVFLADKVLTALCILKYGLSCENNPLILLAYPYGMLTYTILFTILFYILRRNTMIRSASALLAALYAFASGNNLFLLLGH